jgi:exo-beta-1,3-glucanase (GH17 family)
VREISTGVTREPGLRLLGIAIFLVAYAGLTAGVYHVIAVRRGDRGAATAMPLRARRDVSLRGSLFQVGGEPFLVKAVGWDPARPGELPWTRRFDASLVDADFERIRSAGFNTIRTWASMRPEELALAEKHGLRVLQGIWVPPDADFRDPATRRRVLAEVARDAEASRTSAAILGYLVMNEPRARAVARAGLDATAAFLREVVATVRAIDPGVPIGYASWPGMEALDDELLDFVGFNLYPHRPRVAMDELGIIGYTRLLQETVARGRPLVVTEFGISVSPHRSPGGRGGASAEEQAAGLVEMDRELAAAGVAGTSVFQWNDGWWKNSDREGDEDEHDPDDPEEWFGLVAFSGAGDRIGTPRPALARLAQYNRAVLVEPASGQVAGSNVPVRIFAAEPLSTAVSIRGGPAVPLPLARTGRNWLAGTLSLPAGEVSGVEFELVNADGLLVHRESRVLAGAGHPDRIALSPARLSIRPGRPFALEVSASRGRRTRRVVVAAYSEDRYEEQRTVVQVPPAGRALARFIAPAEETIVTVLAFEDEPRIPPELRAAALASVEVRGGAAP